MHRSLSMLAIALTLLLAATATAHDSLHGLWRIAYEPTAAGRAAVSELSTGYLLLMPNGTYYEMREDCCDRMRVMPEPMAYRVDGSTVILSARRADGTPYERRLRSVGKKRVALREGKKWVTSTAPVLQAGDDLNYAWARVYPLVTP